MENWIFNQSRQLKAPPTRTIYASFQSVSLPRRRPRGLLRVPTPQTSAETREQKRRLIKAHFQTGEVHFRPWEISGETSEKTRKALWEVKTLTLLELLELS